MAAQQTNQGRTHSPQFQLSVGATPSSLSGLVPGFSLQYISILDAVNKATTILFKMFIGSNKTVLQNIFTAWHCIRANLTFTKIITFFLRHDTASALIYLYPAVS
jgi:hypothetical protein